MSKNQNNNNMTQANHQQPCQLILVLDLATEDEVFAILDRVGPTVQWVKIGLQLYLRYGAPLVEKIARRGYTIFLDLKLHDIPNTVASAIKNLQGMPIKMLTLHTCGGSEMMQRARDAQHEALPDTQLLGVTVLTSMNETSLQEIGCARTVIAQVEHLAQLAIDTGIQGLVCSPMELQLLRKRLGHTPILVTPGIRPAGSAANDQKRIMTPAQAAAAGSSFIVVGRPILAADNQRQAALNIVAELSAD